MLQSPSQENPLFKLRNGVLDCFYAFREHKVGQVLTIIDACTTDPEQRKSLKDVIRDAFYGKEYWSDDMRKWLWEYARKFKPEHCQDEDGFMSRIPLASTPPLSPNDVAYFG